MLLTSLVTYKFDLYIRHPKGDLGHRFAGFMARNFANNFIGLPHTFQTPIPAISISLLHSIEHWLGPGMSQNRGSAGSNAAG